MDTSRSVIVPSRLDSLVKLPIEIRPGKLEVSQSTVARRSRSWPKPVRLATAMAVAARPTASKPPNAAHLR